MRRYGDAKTSAWVQDTEDFNSGKPPGDAHAKSERLPEGVNRYQNAVSAHVCFSLDRDRTADIQDRQLRATSGHLAPGTIGLSAKH
jgi:hypothetical protein